MHVAADALSLAGELVDLPLFQNNSRPGVSCDRPGLSSLVSPSDQVGHGMQLSLKVAQGIAQRPSNPLRFRVPPVRFERTTDGFEVRHSVH